jgi:predicted nucleic acid-binding protein
MKNHGALVFDTGALIALERRRQRMMTILRTAKIGRVQTIVPSVCVAEWWRGRSDLRDDLLASVKVEPTDDALMKITGEALAAVPGATAIDAIVMALAARHGAVVYTSDFEDLTRLQRAFPTVRVLSV